MGAICLAVILLYADWRLYGGAHTKLPDPGKDFPLAFMTLALIASGLVYSYIISAPITVIHFGRSGRSTVEQHVRYFWFGWVLSLGVVQLSGATGDRLFQSSLGLVDVGLAGLRWLFGRISPYQQNATRSHRCTNRVTQTEAQTRFSAG